MPLRLLTAPAGAGKTQFVLDRISNLHACNTLPRVLIIVPSGAQLIAFRHRLGEMFGVTLTAFHTLYHDVLDTAGELPRLMPEAARYRVMRHVIATTSLDHFAPIAEKPGFIASVAKRIAELKEASVFPENFAEVADTPRTRDLAAIYIAYQNFLLKHNIADREGMGWLARDALKNNSNLYADFDYIAVDGFDQFNPTQREILNLLAARVPRLDITLTHQSNRLAHTRFDKTLAQFSAARESLAAKIPPRVEPLEHLEKFLFEPNAPRAPHGEAIHLITAPDRVREVREIARAAKRLILAGADASRIAVLFRSLEPYQAIVREVFTEFGIPFRVRSPLALETNPLIAALLNLLHLATNDFAWRDTLDVLHTPYFNWRGLSDADIQLIETITRESVVVRNREAWLAAFTPKPPREDEDEETSDAPSAEQLDALRAKIDDLFKKVTPPERGTVRTFAEFIAKLIGPDPHSEAWQRENNFQVAEDATSLRIIERAREGDPEIAARDVAALAAFTDVVRGMIEADEIIGASEIAWNDFLNDLNDAVGAATYDLTPSAEQRVIIATVTQMRGVPQDIVLLGGLVESEFPARTPQDTLFTDTERATLAERGVPLQDLGARDETTMFYEAATLARRKIFLAYPDHDEGANENYPSPYLSSVKKLFDALPTTQIKVNAIPQPDECASLSELAVSLAQFNAPSIARKLRENEIWQHSLFAREIEKQRESLDPFDTYSGVLGDESLRAETAEKFGAKYVWSASQFNDWGACGFKFFARRLLKLEEITDPEEGLDVIQLGTLYHAILEETYRKFIKLEIAVTSETLEQAQKILRDCATPILDDAPENLGFRPTAWWSHERTELLRRLDALLLAESERTPTQPFAVEVEFGFRNTPPVKIKLADDTIRVRGKIDRIDQTANGVVLMDYKSGSTPISTTQVIEGRNVQMPVYVFAAEALGHRVANAFFVHIRNGKTSGELSKTERDDYLQVAKEHMARFVTQARAGQFPVKPARFENGTCARHCEFGSLCRVGRWSVNKKLSDAD